MTYYAHAALAALARARSSACNFVDSDRQSRQCGRLRLARVVRPADRSHRARDECEPRAAGILRRRRLRAAAQRRDARERDGRRRAEQLRAAALALSRRRSSCAVNSRPRRRRRRHSRDDPRRHERYGEVFCPHTATAMRVLENLRARRRRRRDWAVVATAHPAKFEEHRRAADRNDHCGTTEPRRAARAAGPRRPARQRLRGIARHPARGLTGQADPAENRRHLHGSVRCLQYFSAPAGDGQLEANFMAQRLRNELARRYHARLRSGTDPVGQVASGAVAQLGERRVRNAKVGSSILLRSTSHVNKNQ